MNRNVRLSKSLLTLVSLSLFLCDFDLEMAMHQSAFQTKTITILRQLKQHTTENVVLFCHTELCASLDHQKNSLNISETSPFAQTLWIKGSSSRFTHYLDSEFLQNRSRCYTRLVQSNGQVKDSKATE